MIINELADLTKDNDDDMMNVDDGQEGTIAFAEPSFSSSNAPMDE